MVVYLNDDDRALVALTKYRKAKEDLLRAEVQRDLPSPELVAVFKDAALSLAEAIDQEARS